MNVENTWVRGKVVALFKNTLLPSNLHEKKM